MLIGVLIIACLAVFHLPVKCEAMNVFIPDQVTFCGEAVPVDNSDVRERLETQLLIYSNQKVQVTLWFKRCNRYFPTIEKILKDRKMHDDLKYIPVIESSLIPRARSSQNALGLWQFMGPTAQERGLEIREGIDERMNLDKSTDSALDYLSYLKSNFSSWALALAAYNVGQNRIREEIYNQGTMSYYEMILPDETERYVFNAVAVKLIFENPERYGFNREEIAPFQTTETREIEIRLINFVPVKLLAFCAGTHYRGLRTLNPWLTGVNLEKGNYTMKIPASHAGEFSKKLNSYFEKIKGYNEFRNQIKVTVKGKPGLMRLGPGKEYPVFRELSEGTTLRVSGRTEKKDDDHYWYIFKQKNGASGWIWGGEVTE